MSYEIDRYAHIDSIMHRWDPRYKIASLGLFMITTALLQSLPLVLVTLSIAIITLLSSRIPIPFIFQGLKWVLIFLLPFFVLLPFSYPTAHEAYLFGLAFSWEGFRLAILINLKAFAVIMLCYATFGSARFHDSMYALQKLHCPSYLVSLLLFCYRYIFVLLDQMQRMFKAMLSRGLQPRLNKRTLVILGHFVGSLLIRSFERSERIYHAMLAKGYSGQFYCLRQFKTQTTDITKTIFFTVISIIIFSTDRFGPFQKAILAWY